MLLLGLLGPCLLDHTAASGPGNGPVAGPQPLAVQTRSGVGASETLEPALRLLCRLGGVRLCPILSQMASLRSLKLYPSRWASVTIALPGSEKA